MFFLDYTINLFGNQTKCELLVEGNSLIIKVSENEQIRLERYINRILSRYGKLPVQSEFSLQEMINCAIELEKNISGNLSEPTVKLPYEFLPEVKEMLVETASLQGISATQLLIKIIEDKYDELFNQVK